MSISTTTLPAGTLPSDLTFNDDLAQVHQRMAYHQARLGLPSRQTDDIAAANHYLYRLAAAHTRAEAEEQLRTVSHMPLLAAEFAAEVASEPTAPSTPTAVNSVSASATPNGYARLTRAFASGQPAQVRASSPTRPTPTAPATPTQTGPTGVARIAAAYAKTAQTSSSATN